MLSCCLAAAALSGPNFVTTLLQSGSVADAQAASRVSLPGWSGDLYSGFFTVDAATASNTYFVFLNIRVAAAVCQRDGQHRHSRLPLLLQSLLLTDCRHGEACGIRRPETVELEPSRYGTCQSRCHPILHRHPPS